MKSEALITVAVAFLSACGPKAPPTMPSAEDPTLLVATEALGPDFTLQQKVHATFGERELLFQAIIQKNANTLTIVALTPQGTRAFVLEQTGKKVEFEQLASRNLPFSPWHILVDIHRSYFRGGREKRADGRHTVDQGKEIMHETWRDGALVERTFEQLEAERKGLITVRYGEGSGNLLGRTLSYHNGYLGYTLDVEPIRYTEKAAPALPVADDGEAAAGSAVEGPPEGAFDDMDERETRW